MLKLDLLRDMRTLRKDGSVNATLASLKEKLDWDRRDGKQTGGAPDDATALAELEGMLRGLRAG